MVIAIIIGIIFLIILCALILKGNKNDETKDTLKVKVQPITKGRSYPWFYVKECLYYFPITALSEYEGETKQTLIDELAEVQKTANFEKVIKICDQIISRDYKYSKAWIDKINAIFNNILIGKEWNASVSKNILNCAYNYTKSFNNTYDKSVNAKHSLVPIIIKRANELIIHNRENLSETYSFEIYNLLINLYYLMPYSEFLEVAYINLEKAKNLEEIKQNRYAEDTVKALISHVGMLKRKYKITIEKEDTEELKIVNKNIIVDETYSTSWIGFGIQFPKNVNKVELMFKFYDHRRQEIDLSDGKNKRMTELFKASDSADGYNVVVLSEDRIKYVTIEVYDAIKIKQGTDSGAAKLEEFVELKENNEQGKKISNEVKEDISVRDNKLKEKQEVKNEVKNKDKKVEEKTNEDIKKESEEKTDEYLEKEVENRIGEENEENVRYKLYPSFSGVKQISLTETFCLFLKEDGKVDVIGNFEKIMDIQNWERIEKLYTTSSTVYAIRKDGTITVAGKSVYDNWEYQYQWRDIQKLEPSYNHIVGLKIDGTVVAVGDNTYGECDIDEWSRIVDISASFHTVGLDKEGKVFAVGANKFGECDVGNWTGIEKIATGPFFTVGLRTDGTVVAAGLNSCGQCNTNDWKNVKDIYVKGNVTVGLKYDGTVLVAGRNSYRFEEARKWQNIKDIKIVNDRIIGITNDGRINYIGKPYWGRAEKDWKNISAIEANSTCILGKKEDGRLVCNKPLFGFYMPENYENFADIKQSREADKVVVLEKDGIIDLFCINNIDLYKWDTGNFKNIKQIAMSKTHLIGLKHDGTAVITGNDNSLNFLVESWKNLIKVGVGEKFAVGLTIDGRVLAAGNNLYNQCDTIGWLDVVDIAVYGMKVIGLKSDGTVLITGNLEYDEEDFIKEARNIVGIAINSKQIMLLDNQGDVSLSYSPFGEDKRSVLAWRNIIKIAANENSFIGVKSDNTLISTNIKGLERWDGISDVRGSGEYVIGISRVKK